MADGKQRQTLNMLLDGIRKSNAKLTAGDITLDREMSSVC
jgi:hypothetical protein